MAHVGSDTTALAQKHTFIRSYQACVPCRKRKVRCDLGDPGNPSDPPCRRCRREHKDCFFQDLRTKKGGSSKNNESTHSAKRMRSETPTESTGTQPRATSASRIDSFVDVYTSTASTSTHVAASISPNDSATTDRILHKEVHNANEALNLLYEAAAESRSESDEGKNGQSFGTRFSDKDDPNTEAWREFWCVKAGWMTDVEAKCYIDFFFNNLNPLAPIISPILKENHSILVKSEHALANTILTISARYYTLQGIGGASRSYAIHDRLWRYTRTLLNKLPFSGSQAVRKPGMVESLLLLTEWHPRNYHFPDDDPTEEQYVPSDNRTESSLEPAYRSDRMCWMLLANAICLAYDIGIFDDDEDSRATRSTAYDIDQKYRKTRLQYLCYVYIHSFSARYGRGSALLPNHITVNTERWINQNSLQPPIGTNEQDWRYIWGAVGLTKLMKNASEVLFANKRHTRELLMTGRYTSLLSHYEPVLQNWRQSFDQHSPPVEESKLMLLVEWEYIRLYINSLALQAVAERESSHVVGVDGQAVQISEDDAVYIDHVVDASKAILNYMIYEFAPRGYLQLSPVKVFLRIISAAVFLVKALALGRGAADLNTSFSLLDSTVQILRSTSIDDLHLANRFSLLLESVLKHIRIRFLPGQTIPDLSGADDLLGLSGEITPGLLPFDASLAPFGVGVGKTWLGADGGGMEFLEWLMKGDDLDNLVSS